MTILRFNDSKTIYKIPQVLDITHDTILDNKTRVYRIVIGKVCPTDEEKTLYAKIFKVIDKRLETDIFLDDFIIEQGDYQVEISLAYITRTKKDYGIFYDIEIGLEDIKFTKGNMNEGKKVTESSNITHKKSQ